MAYFVRKSHIFKINPSNFYFYMEDYLNLVKSNRYLNSLPKLEAEYRPYHDLDLKLKESVLFFIQENTELIQKEKRRFSADINDYIFLEERRKVDVKKMPYLIDFISWVQGEAFGYSPATLRDFWIRARISSLKKT